MSQIRAQIRASVFKAIEENPADPEDKVYFNWENQRALEIWKNREAVILCKLFQNYLAFYDLDYTENVFKYEVNLPEVSEEEIKAIGVDTKDGSQPWLF